MILTDTKILEEIEKGTIVISPFDRNCLGSNSYDVHLGKYLATYRNEVLDARESFCFLIASISASRKSTPKPTAMFLFSKERAVSVDSGLTSTRQQEKGTSGSAIPGPLRSPSSNRFASMRACPSVS
jgi:hypothetical protein